MEARRIPLFPLNVVLFPGMRLPLHIFEERYQLMIRRCLETDRLFGVCLIRAGAEVGGPAVPCSIGTTCEILSTSELGEGRMLLATVGRERFRILRLHHDEPYLEADVEPLPDPDSKELGDLPAQVETAIRHLISQVMALRGEGEPDQPIQLPTDPASLSFHIAAILQTPLTVQQKLLEILETGERLRYQLALLEQATEQVAQEAAEPVEAARPFQFSPDDLSQN